jgi:hypothetical protein
VRPDILVSEGAGRNKIGARRGSRTSIRPERSYLRLSDRCRGSAGMAGTPPAPLVNGHLIQHIAERDNLYHFAEGLPLDGYE